MAPEGPPVYRKMIINPKDSIGVTCEFAWKTRLQAIILICLPWYTEETKIRLLTSDSRLLTYHYPLLLRYRYLSRPCPGPYLWM